jgi:hypothetical protein
MSANTIFFNDLATLTRRTPRSSDSPRATMTRFFKVVFALWLLILLGVPTIAVHRHRVRQAMAIAQLYDGIRPVPTNAPRIPAPGLSQLVNADFKVVTNLRYVPSPVKDSFCTSNGATIWVSNSTW